MSGRSKKRCPWSGTDPMYVEYHDTEWGIPVHDDRRHFEMIILEGAQAGLNWLTILKKREGYRRAFARFDPRRVARFTRRDVARLLTNEGIVRNRLKVESAVSNAQAFLKIMKEFGSFDTYVWKFVGGRPRINRPRSISAIRSTTPQSDALSKDLKLRGFRFVGPTIIYAYMQAAGLVNDHIITCFRKGVL